MEQTGKGIVIKSTGSWYHVRTHGGQVVPCRIRGKFRVHGIKSTNPVAVGDHVHFMLKEDQTGLITQIEERKNFIPRKSVKLSKRVQIIAANIDLLFLIVTVKHPKTYTSFIDRFFATAEAYDIDSVIVINKTDLYNAEDLEVMNEWKYIYESIGYPCLTTSVTRNENLEALKQMMKDKVSLFSGHSGVGKSSLINSLEPGLHLPTRELTRLTKQGAHTTTYAEMFPLSFGGYIVDTPGIKGFGVVDFSEEETGDYFVEIFARKKDCKFHNCRHVNEPGCAVIEAVENGEIALSRYQSYLEILLDEDETYR